MKLSVSHRQRGLVGLYWCPALRTLELNLSPRLGIHLKFEQTKAQKDATYQALVEHMERQARLNQLTNTELVDSLAGMPEADNPFVLEAMDRLNPDWYKGDK